MYGLFNIYTFIIVKASLFLYSNKFLLCVVGFDIQEYHPEHFDL